MSDSNKPWAVLRITRKQYDTLKPWKKTPLSREEFGKLILSLPEGFIDELMLRYDADKLIDSIFGEPGDKS